jgi:hypothetical protein
MSWVDERQSKLDPFADKLAGWLKTEGAKSRKQRGTLKQMHADLVALGFDGSYGRVAAFARNWQAGRSKPEFRTETTPFKKDCLLNGWRSLLSRLTKADSQPLSGVALQQTKRRLAPHSIAGVSDICSSRRLGCRTGLQCKRLMRSHDSVATESAKVVVRKIRPESVATEQHQPRHKTLSGPPPRSYLSQPSATTSLS